MGDAEPTFSSPPPLRPLTDAPGPPHEKKKQCPLEASLSVPPNPLRCSPVVHTEDRNVGEESYYSFLFPDLYHPSLHAWIEICKLAFGFGAERKERGDIEAKPNQERNSSSRSHNSDPKEAGTADTGVAKAKALDPNTKRPLCSSQIDFLWKYVYVLLNTGMLQTADFANATQMDTASASPDATTLAWQMFERDVRETTGLLDRACARLSPTTLSVNDGRTERSEGRIPLSDDENKDKENEKEKEIESDREHSSKRRKMSTGETKSIRSELLPTHYASAVDQLLRQWEYNQVIRKGYAQLASTILLSTQDIMAGLADSTAASALWEAVSDLYSSLSHSLFYTDLSARLAHRGIDMHGRISHLVSLQCERWVLVADGQGLFSQKLPLVRFQWMGTDFFHPLEGVPSPSRAKWIGGKLISRICDRFSGMSFLPLSGRTEHMKQLTPLLQELLYLLGDASVALVRSRAWLTVSSLLRTSIWKEALPSKKKDPFDSVPLVTKWVWIATLLRRCLASEPHGGHLTSPSLRGFQTRASCSLMISSLSLWKGFEAYQRDMWDPENVLVTPASKLPLIHQDGPASPVSCASSPGSTSPEHASPSPFPLTTSRLLSKRAKFRSFLGDGNAQTRSEPAGAREEEHVIQYELSQFLEGMRERLEDLYSKGQFSWESKASNPNMRRDRLPPKRLFAIQEWLDLWKQWTEVTVCTCLRLHEVQKSHLEGSSEGPVVIPFFSSDSSLLISPRHTKETYLPSFYLTMVHVWADVSCQTLKKDPRWSLRHVCVAVDHPQNICGYTHGRYVQCLAMKTFAGAQDRYRPLWKEGTSGVMEETDSHESRSKARRSQTHGRREKEKEEKEKEKRGKSPPQLKHSQTSSDTPQRASSSQKELSDSLYHWLALCGLEEARYVLRDTTPAFLVLDV